MPDRLTRVFYRRGPATVARSLLGHKLVRVTDGVRAAGIIVETEAYLGVQDRAAHTFNGRRTPRNETMWGDGGHCYVYFTYGMHHCVNVVTGSEGQPVAVLLRALEPVEGVEMMAERRNRTQDLCSGPGRLCQALAIDRSLDGVDLVSGSGLFIERVPRRRSPIAKIARTSRIGVDYAGEWAKKPLRFHIRDNPHISRG